MPGATVEPVRQPLGAARLRRLPLEDHLTRFPRLVALVARMPPRSRLRQALLRRAIQQAFDATNRRDFAVAFRLYHPDVESTFDRRAISLGFEPTVRGREARIEAQRRWVAEWGELRFELEEVIDLGGRAVREQFFFDRGEAFEAVGLRE